LPTRTRTHTPTRTSSATWTATPSRTHTPSPRPTGPSGSLLNGGFETGDKMGWTDEGEGGAEIDFVPWAPAGGSYRDNQGAPGGEHWIGRADADVEWGLSQAITGLAGAGEYRVSVGVSCNGREGAQPTQQLRVADGNRTGSCDSETGTQLDANSGFCPDWLELSGNYSTTADTITIILWAGNSSLDGWSGNCGMHFDGVTLDRTTKSTDWPLYE
jgi:hypothetical protein